MIDSQASWREQAVSFGPFRLHAARRTLERSGVALNLGSRALEILIVLIEQAGAVERLQAPHGLEEVELLRSSVKTN